MISIVQLFSIRFFKSPIYKTSVFLHLVQPHMRKICKEGNKNVLLSCGLGKASMMPFNVGMLDKQDIFT